MVWVVPVMRQSSTIIKLIVFMWTKSNNDFALGQTETNDSNGSMVWSHEKKS